MKVIPGNSQYAISLQGEISCTNGEACTLPIKDGFVTIALYGEVKIVDVIWLSLIAHYEVDLPVSIRHRIVDIHFADRNPLIRGSISKMQMLIKKPIEFKEGFRIVPDFPRYAVSREGMVIDTITGEKMWINYRSDPKKGYPTVGIRAPDSNEARGVGVHRLVALAWIKNSDPFERCVVNHIDGDKINFAIKNLEWVTYSQNSIHAFENGLRSDNIPCVIYDTKTGKVKNFASVRTACVYMGIDPEVDARYAQTYKQFGKLIKDRYEIRINGDTTPWHSESETGAGVSGRYEIQLTHPDGQVKKYYNLKVASTLLGFPKTNYGSSKVFLMQVEKRMPGVTVKFVDRYHSGAVQAYEVATGKVYEAGSIRDMAVLVDRQFSQIQRSLMRKNNCIAGGFVYREKSDKPWDTNFAEYSGHAKCILATHIRTREQLMFDSQRHAAEHFKVSRKLIAHRLKTKILHLDWFLEEVDDVQ